MEVLGENLTVETVAFIFPVDGGGTEVKEAQMAYAPIKICKVADLMEYHTRFAMVQYDINKINIIVHIDRRH